jgi:hypothetical protein
MHRAPAPRRLRRRSRLVLAVVATLAVVGSLFWHEPDPVAASAGDEAAFVAALNRVRADNGLPAFTVNAELSDLSRGHAQVMADAGEIFHADPISEGYSGQWSKIGENVGVGANVEVLVDAFVASSGHYANIVDPAFTQIGVGVVWKDSALYTTHRFLQVPGTSPTTPPTTAPPTTTPPTAPPTQAPVTTAPTTQAPTTTDPAPTPTAAPLPAPAITAERVVALLEMLEQVGT